MLKSHVLHFKNIVALTFILFYKHVANINETMFKYRVWNKWLVMGLKVYRIGISPFW